MRAADSNVGAFAVLALALGVAGIYSVLTSAVTRRTHEIGVRLAPEAAVYRRRASPRSSR